MIKNNQYKAHLVYKIIKNNAIERNITMQKCQEIRETLSNMRRTNKGEFYKVDLPKVNQLIEIKRHLTIKLQKHTMLYFRLRRGFKGCTSTLVNDHSRNLFESVQLDYSL